MQRRAFVIGNAAWDEALHVAALPAPGASIHARPGIAGAGGKGLNQAATLARAGVRVDFVAAVGADARGTALFDALEAEGLASALLRRSGVATDHSIVLVVDGGDNAIITTRQAAATLRPDDVSAALAQARAGDLCLLQGNLDADTTAAAVDHAAGHGMFVALNPSPVAPRVAELFAHVDALFLNTEEADELTGKAAAQGAVRDLLDRGVRQVVLTLGARGALLAHSDGTVRIPAEPVHAVDPTAAGDVFTAAALAHAAHRGWRPDIPALRAGARAAALAVGRRGALAALPTREELAGIMAAP